MSHGADLRASRLGSEMKDRRDHNAPISPELLRAYLDAARWARDSETVRVVPTVTVTRGGYLDSIGPKSAEHVFRAALDAEAEIRAERMRWTS